MSARAWIMFTLRERIGKRLGRHLRHQLVFCRASSRTWWRHLHVAGKDKRLSRGWTEWRNVVNNAPPSHPWSKSCSWPRLFCSLHSTILPGDVIFTGDLLFSAFCCKQSNLRFYSNASMTTAQSTWHPLDSAFYFNVLVFARFLQANTSVSQNMSWDKTQQVGNNQTFKCFKQVMQRYGNLVSALAYQPLFLLVLLLAPNKNVAQEIDASKILPDGYNSQMRPGNPLEYSKSFGNWFVLPKQVSKW